jgi:uncharacterized membrane protein YccC
VSVAVDCVARLLVAFARTAWRRRGEPDAVRAARAPLPIAPMPASLRRFDEHARDGVRRAIPPGILMCFLQLHGWPDAFWTFFAAYLVLLTPGKAPRNLAAIRVGSTAIGSILMAGAPTGAIGTWSTHRLLDTLVGCAIALVANYLLWPRDTEAQEAPPVTSSAPPGPPG